jgi:hypothetical protein
LQEDDGLPATRYLTAEQHLQLGSRGTGLDIRKTRHERAMKLLTISPIPASQVASWIQL